MIQVVLVDNGGEEGSIISLKNNHYFTSRDTLGEYKLNNNINQ